MEELTAFRGLGPVLRSRWWLQWNERIYATDASEKGFGITQNQFSRACVAQMGRTREVSRFKLHPGSSARQSALGDGIGTQVDSLMRNELGDAKLLDDAFVGVDHSVRDADANFPEIPTSVTDAPRWAIVGCGKWRFEDNIVRLEAHALIKGIQSLGITTFWDTH